MICIYKLKFHVTQGLPISYISYNLYYRICTTQY